MHETIIVKLAVFGLSLDSVSTTVAAVVAVAGSWAAADSSPAGSGHSHHLARRREYI